MRIWATPAIIAGAIVAQPAAAQNVDATRPDTVVAALREAGYRAVLDKDNSGDPLVKSGAAGVDFSVYFYNCTANKACKTVQFHAGFVKKGVTLDTINTWNATHRFARAYLDDEKDPRIEMDVDLDHGGLPTKLFQANLATWDSLVGEFQKTIDF
ncbi:YbjN domain-containing protein [Sphingomonas sp. 2R-10]|uniref:YbjN domain-containing protein n=1 Tax=Sphingomonas sp. 2R-10 TaxID=3045148 RepID=UPI0013DDD30E|nr:YbjN domain-containing protein [Sphingomonas sp. 2R-10]MDJ0277025.1 YbjN domain-containing protein [Sphingomonas sp. 2R-10]